MAVTSVSASPGADQLGLEHERIPDRHPLTPAQALRDLGVFTVGTPYLYPAGLEAVRISYEDT
jgi:hypothetical protein